MLKRFFALLLAAGLITVQTNVRAFCAPFGESSITCKMGCCKKGTIPLGCPQLQVVEAPDMVMTSAPSVTPVLVVIATLKTIDPALTVRPERVAERAQAPPPISLVSTPPGRSPPASASLL
jgi:hypothetical protein